MIDDLLDGPGVAAADIILDRLQIVVDCIGFNDLVIVLGISCTVAHPAFYRMIANRQLLIRGWIMVSETFDRTGVIAIYIIVGYVDVFVDPVILCDFIVPFGYNGIAILEPAFG